MAIQGLRDTTNFVTDARPKNWREGLLLLEPNGMAPLTGLTSVMSKRTVDDPEFYWWEKTLKEKRLELDADIPSGSSGDQDDLTVKQNATHFKEGDLLQSEETDEIFLVRADPNTDTILPVIRDWPNAGNATTLDYDATQTNPWLFWVGSTYEEGSDAPTGINFDPAKTYNYTQIFRDTLELTNTAIQTNLRTEDAVREAKREALQYHSMSLERAFWFNQRSEKTKNGKPVRTMNGIIPQIPASRTSDARADSDQRSGVNANVDMEQFEGYLLDIFKWGGNEKMAWCGNRALMTIQQMVRKNSSFQIQSGIQEFGMNVTRLTTPFGELVFKTHPMFNQMGGGTNDASNEFVGMEASLVVLDMENLRYVNLRNRDTQFEERLADQGIDGRKSGYLSEVSMELHHPDTHYKIDNLNSAAADN